MVCLGVCCIDPNARPISKGYFDRKDTSKDLT